MLVFLRKASQTLFAKILLLLLVVSFGVWGVSASLFSNTSDTVVAVGDQTVSSNDFAFAYQRQVADMSSRFGCSSPPNRHVPSASKRRYSRSLPPARLSTSSRPT